MRETEIASAVRNLRLLEVVVRDGGSSSVSALARAANIPIASAHRHVAAMVTAGYLVPAGYGRHLAGPTLRAIAGMAQARQIMTHAAAPILERLASRTRCVAQLGIFEHEMVTYLAKAGHSADDLFTKVGMQLEAYASGIGKVLLAGLPEPMRTQYLANGPFVALTERTITDPRRLHAELDKVAVQGFAQDDEEVIPGLTCLAVPVRNREGVVVAAISVSRATGGDVRRGRGQTLALLNASAKEIGEWAN